MYPRFRGRAGLRGPEGAGRVSRALSRGTRCRVLGRARSPRCSGATASAAASMLAHLAPQRLFAENTQMAMSGPSIIASAAGMNVLDEMFRAMAEASLSPAARVKASRRQRPVEGRRRPVGMAREALAQRGEAATGIARFATRRWQRASTSAWPGVPGNRSQRRDLEKIYGAGYEARESDGLIRGSGTRAGDDEVLRRHRGRRARSMRFARMALRRRRLEDVRAVRPRASRCSSTARRTPRASTTSGSCSPNTSSTWPSRSPRSARRGTSSRPHGARQGGRGRVRGARRAGAARGERLRRRHPGASRRRGGGDPRARALKRAGDFDDYSAAGVADEELKLGIIPGTK